MVAPNAETGTSSATPSQSPQNMVADGAVLPSNPDANSSSSHSPPPASPANTAGAGKSLNSSPAASLSVVAVEQSESLGRSTARGHSDEPGASVAGSSSSSNPTPSHSAQHISQIAPPSTSTDAPQGSKSVAVLLAKLNAMGSEMERFLGTMSPDEAAAHSEQLSKLAGVFQSCVSKFPVPSSGQGEGQGQSVVPNADDQPAVEKESDQPPETFLDTLPVGPIENLIRFFSARPRNEDWPKHISSFEAESLYLDEGQLGESFRKKFTNIELVTGASAPKSGEIFLSTRAPRSRTNQVLEKCGKHIKTLAYVGDRDEDSPPHMTSWIDPYRLHCNNITHLTLHRVHVSYFEDILKSRSGKLESLSLDIYTSSRPHLYIVGRYCCGLKKLSLSTGLSAPELLWEKLGPSLEELKITPSSKPYTPRSILKNVTEHCKNLSRFIVNKHFSQIDDMANLLKGLGDRLTFAKADFSHLTFNQVQEIGNACPNAMFEFSGTGVLKLDVIMALGYRIETLTFSKRMVDMVVPPNFFDNLTPLKSITLAVVEGDTGWFLSNLLNQPKPNLREINITTMQDNPVEILELIATKMTKLNKLKLWCRELPVEGLEKLVMSNQEMHKITLKARPAPMERIRQVLKVCAECKVLKELRIGRISLPSPPPPPRSNAADTVGYSTAHEIARTADACMPFRRRNTFVQILGVDYVC